MKSITKKARPINPSIPQHTQRYLRQLTHTGVHGTTTSEAARILIYDQIKYLLRKGVLKWEYEDADGESP